MPQALKPKREPDRTEFGQRMFDARKAAGLSQEDVRDRLGLAQSVVSDAERKAKGSTHVVRFADLYGVNAEWLSTGKGHMKSAGVKAGSEWPFERIDIEQWRSLSERWKGVIEHAAVAALMSLQAGMVTVSVDRESRDPIARDLLRLYETLQPDGRELLYAYAQRLHNPQPDGPTAEGQPDALPTPAPVRNRRR